MLMPKKDRHAIFEYLFKEGVLVAKKDFYAAKHNQIPVPNLHVIKAMQSLVSRGFAKEQFAWRHYYWSLTNEGITYLREYLNLPPEIVPATLKRATRERAPGERDVRERGPRGGPEKDESDRDAYRRGGEGVDKTGEAGIGAGGLEFKGGFGRGKPL